MADKKSKSTRSQSQIEADLNARRQRLTTSLESLIDEVHPNRIKQRGTARLKAIAAEYQEKGKSLIFNARGDLRTNRLVAVGGGAAGFLTFVTVVRRLIRRRRS